MIQLLFLIGCGFFAVMAVRRYLRTAPPAAARQLRSWLFGLGVLVALLLAASGRLAILIPFLGALLAAALRLLPVLLPMLLQFLPLWRRRQRAAGARPADGGGDASTVEAGFLRMRLDHASGEIGGEVLAGRQAGRQLNELSLEQLLELYGECQRRDPDSATLLRAYLDRVYGGDWEAARDAGREPSPAGGRMTVEEALAVLGVAPGASREDIVGAHRRLMQRLHPDRGGSDYLAAKINQAKDVLLNS